MFGRVYSVIKERRIEIENTPLDKPLRRDMLMSFITANTPRDINNVKQSKEILGNIFIADTAEIDTVSKKCNYLDELHYCDAVIKEVTRHCPVAFALARVNIENDEIEGFNWPERTSFRLLYCAMMKLRIIGLIPKNLILIDFTRLKKVINI